MPSFLHASWPTLIARRPPPFGASRHSSKRGWERTPVLSFPSSILLYSPPSLKEKDKRTQTVSLYFPCFSLFWLSLFMLQIFRTKTSVRLARLPGWKEGNLASTEKTLPNIVIPLLCWKSKETKVKKEGDPIRTKRKNTLTHQTNVYENFNSP